MSMIRVVNVTHHYSIKPVLREVNLEVARGEVVALMGPNGMGKSTLMGVIAGALWPIKGHTEINGLRRRGTPGGELEIRRQVIYLPADPWLPKQVTGREWLLAVGEIYGLDTDRVMHHCDRLLELFNLTEQADSLIGSYSTGQQKKIALSGALITEAPVMLLDEPFSGGLDPSGILALRRVLQHLAKRDDVTIVMATPVPELVEEIADRVAIIHQGRIVACDSVAGLRASAGGSGTLAEIYEKLVNPRQSQNIERYFEAMP
jgi:ABC-type multidrug transport system ATPase subunit